MAVRLVGYVLMSVLVCALVAWVAGGWSFVRRPLGAALLAVWFFWWLSTALLRRVGRASNYSRRAVGLALAMVPAYLVIVVVVPWEYGHFSGPIPRDGPLAWVGLAVLAAGAVFGAWAMKTLGDSFTVRLNVAAGQKLVTTGPYAVVRHPAYLSYFLALLGLGLALSSLAGIGLAVVAGIVLAWRTRHEEQMLLAEFGDEYRDYTRRTRRLLPFIY
jgi:protein-S-isoprenylcysteine O-methyltransferase Ste14